MDFLQGQSTETMVAVAVAVVAVTAGAAFLLLRSGKKGMDMRTSYYYRCAFARCTRFV